MVLYIDGLVQDCNNSIVNALELLQSCTKPSISWYCIQSWPHFYQTRSAWSVDQGSNKNHSPAYNFAPTVTKFCVMWEGLSLPHDTKFGNCRCKIVDSRAFPNWSLIHGLRWSGLIKAEPAVTETEHTNYLVQDWSISSVLSMEILQSCTKLLIHTIYQNLCSRKHPYLTLTGKLWCVFCEDFGEDWPCYDGLKL